MISNIFFTTNSAIVKLILMTIKVTTVIAFISLFSVLTACSDNTLDKIKKDPAPALGPWCMDEKDRLPGQPKPYCGSLVSLAAINIREAELTLINQNLDRPWAMEFISDNKLLITEFKGKLKTLDIQTNHLVELAGVPPVAFGQGQRGLLDVAIHPLFAQNQLIYFSYVAKSDLEEKYALVLARAKLEDKTITNVKTIFTALPYSESSSNFGGAILFDQDRKLILSVGDRSFAKKSQDPLDYLGKIIRINDDGTIPKDNPYIDNSMVLPEIFATGVRNPQGMVIDPKSGLIYETEHGPMGGDEVNIINSGVNYGWPKISYGMNYTYKRMGIGTEHKGLAQPLFYYLPSRAISPIEIYYGDMFPEWNGDLLVGSLRALSISKLDLVDGKIISESTILNEVNGRIRDIKTASDGSIYILVENGHLFQLKRRKKNLDKEEVVVGQRSGEEIYRLACQTCHNNDILDTPQFGVIDDWRSRLEKGNFNLKVNAILGINNMPAKGNCTDCTRQEVGLAVDFILENLPQ
ncbi:MAG: glucose/arabinose dehydrogenase/cytochrome c5 [Pseudomonadales bacterium]|jgi:glucose/arabinose dehydrogenase/cytochrome c5